MITTQAFENGQNYFFHGSVLHESPFAESDFDHSDLDITDHRSPLIAVFIPDAAIAAHFGGGDTETIGDGIGCILAALVASRIVCFVVLFDTDDLTVLVDDHYVSHLVTSMLYLTIIYYDRCIMSSVFLKKLFVNETGYIEEKYPVARGDATGGPIDPWCEVEDAEKGHAFDEMWGIKGRE